MRLLFILLSGCSTLHSYNQDVETFSSQSLDCPLTVKVDASCLNYERLKYKVVDSTGLTQSFVLYPGEEFTIDIASGRFEIKRISFAGPGFVFPNGLKREKTTTNNFCEEKFTTQLFCD